MVCYLLYHYDDDYREPCLKILQFTEMKRHDPNSYRFMRTRQYQNQYQNLNAAILSPHYDLTE
jgi:hypothetical protein